MRERNEYKVVILCTMDTIRNVMNYIPLWHVYLHPKSFVVIAPSDVCNTLSDKQWNFEIECLNEDTIYETLNYQNVKRKIRMLSGNKKSAEKRTGWYFQQFLKMAYCKICKEKSYLVWDADTIPTHYIYMKKDEVTYYFDVKTEYNKAYFDTMRRLFPELSKESSYSFISEHMIIKKDIMSEIISAIERNHRLQGEAFWEKILNVIDLEQLGQSGFSEFEMYGTYVSRYYNDQYCIRKWTSLREGTVFFDNGYIDRRLLKELAKKYDAVSFENHLIHKRMSVFFSHKLFQNLKFIYMFDTIKSIIKRVL